MILQTAGNGTQAVRGLGQAGNPWNPPMLLCFELSSSVKWTHHLKWMWNKCRANVETRVNVRGEISYVYLWLKLFKPQLEVFPFWSNFQMMSVQATWHSSFLSNTKRRSFRRISARSTGAFGSEWAKPLELLGFVKIIYTPYLYTILMKMMMKHEEYPYTYVIISYIDVICMYTSDFERKTAKRYCDSGWTSGCLHIFHPRWI